MKYYYYVSYCLNSSDYRSVVFGSAEITADNEITSMSHIKKITEWLESDLMEKGVQQPSVCIINYSLLRSE